MHLMYRSCIGCLFGIVSRQKMYKCLSINNDIYMYIPGLRIKAAINETLLIHNKSSYRRVKRRDINFARYPVNSNANANYAIERKKVVTPHLFSYLCIVA